MPASSPRVRVLALVGACVLACGSEGDDMASATDSTTTGATTDGQTSTSAADSEAGGVDTDGSVAAVDGVLLSDAGHHYECIDGCEGFYSSDRYVLQLTAEETRDVEVAWWGWAIDGGSPYVGDEPYAIEAVHLEPGAPVTIDLRFDHTGLCSFKEWSVPLTLVVAVDGVEVEIAGTSTAGYGWDC